MANFVDKINEAIKQAMREKRTDDLSTLRMLLSALRNKKIEQGNKEELKDEEALAVLKSEVKKRKDSIVSYREGQREDLVAKEQAEIDFINQYLPEQMSEAAVEEIVKKIISEVADPNPKNFGQIMASAMKETKGQADGQVVGAVVKRLLTK